MISKKTFNLKIISGIKMKKFVVYLILVVMFLSSSVFLVSPYALFKNQQCSERTFLDHIDTIKTIYTKDDPLPLYANRLDNQTDIPTWHIDDTWIYYADIHSNSDNGAFDLSSTDLTITVIDVTTYIENNTLYDVYIINISGTVDGAFSSSIISGDVDGVITGDAYISRSDLSIIASNITSFGFIEFLIFEYDYEILNVGQYTPPSEYFDFPIKSGEMWNISSSAYTQSSFYVEDFYENFSESHEKISGTIACIEVENVSVPAGTFESFHVITDDNGTLETWYSPIIDNAAKLFINQTNENETHLIYMNLSGYSLSSQPLQVTEYINPSASPFGDSVTISGRASYTSSGIPVTNGNVTISIPYNGNQWYTTTNSSGNFSYCIDVPTIIDNTNTTYDIGSEGIIATVSDGSFVGYKIRTLTVLDDSTEITNLLLSWNFVSLPFNHSVNLDNLIVKYNEYYLNWSQVITYENPTNNTIIDQYLFGWNRSTQSYIFANTFEPGYGYWVYVYSGCELRAKNISSSPVDTITKLGESWNIVGVPYNKPIVKTDIIVNDISWDEAVTTGIISDFVFGWSRTGQSYTFSDTFIPGESYWVYAYQPCTLKRAI